MEPRYRRLFRALLWTSLWVSTILLIGIEIVHGTPVGGLAGLVPAVLFFLQQIFE